MSKYFSRQSKIILGFMIFFLVFFTVFSIIKNNAEFTYYSIILLLISIYILKRNHAWKLPSILITSLAILALANSLGGIIYIDGIRLFDIYFNILKYDNIVHMIGTFVVFFVAYNLVDPAMKEPMKTRVSYGIMLIFITIGITVLVEIVEFFGVAFLNSQGVGDYYNNALDLVFNAIGATAGSIIVITRNRKKYKEKNKKK